MAGFGNGESGNATRKVDDLKEFLQETPLYRIPEKKKRVYLSGPMTGIEDFNFPEFNDAAAKLREAGYDVFNPAEQGWGEGDPATGETLEAEYLTFLREDICQVTQCDEIVVLPGWKKSHGATFEVDVARRLGLKISEYCDLSDDGFVLLTPTVYKHEETILQEADRLVSTDRGDQYGHPLDDFGKVVGMAKALWGRGPETEEEHAVYMVLVKIAREANRPKRDNRVDAAGYLKTLDMVIEERGRRG